MLLSAVFPTRDIGDDPGKMRDWAQTAEDLGYARIDVPDHVLGAGTSTRPGWQPLYPHTDPFHETFVVLGFLAAVTSTIGLASGVLVLPQRQTALVAKQAAEADVLSGGRIRLGVGVGWNPVEYTALGTDWTSRGARLSEQIRLLRRLWTEDLVTFHGDFDRVEEAGLNPLPVQRPIPVFVGGGSDAALRRAARLGDGWMPILDAADAGPRLDLLRAALEQAGRDPDAFPVEPWIRMHDSNPDRWAKAVDGWRRIGARTVSLYPMFRHPDLDGHLELLHRLKEVAFG